MSELSLALASSMAASALFNHGRWLFILTSSCAGWRAPRLSVAVLTLPRVSFWASRGPRGLLGVFWGLLGASCGLLGGIVWR
eukprot:9200595-Pyramimonas_sp.AAC.1